MKRRGVTIIELLVVLVITLIVTLAVTRAFGDAVYSEVRVDQSRDIRRQRQVFEDEIKRLLEGAYVTSDETDFETYFIGLSEGGGSGVGADTVRFTTLSRRISAAYLESALEDFEALNEQFGPQGGIAEVSFSMLPYDAGRQEEGIYIRRQDPADGDPTQGGFESLLSADVRDVSFEFWDGLQWVTTWDTQVERRIPAAVRVSYALPEDLNARYAFTVRLIHSDVTPDNPAATGSGSSLGGTG
ncbi:MAG: prepilin-type N-terminal cleavage/methylation domain-containing protein [Fimbriimonadaceae bacterium]